MASTSEPVQPPQRLRALVSWQANKVATVGARLTARHMPLAARADFAVLAALQEYGQLSQAELGRRLGLDRNDISTVLSRLEQDRAVTRKADPDNQRRNIVTVTRAGLRRLSDLQVHADAVQDELLDGLPDTERAQLVRLLEKVLSRHPAQPA
jgi:DNA-binding MarR family transcriptional regulator